MKTLNMCVLKESDKERIVAIPLFIESSAFTKYQIQRRLGNGTVYETISEVVISNNSNVAGQNMITMSDLKIITSDAEQRCIQQS